MARKIIDVNEGNRHLVCYKSSDRSNPFRVYMVISPTGSPVRKRLLIRYGDFMSVIYFIRDFYLYGLDTMSLSEVKEWIDKHSVWEIIHTAF